MTTEPNDGAGRASLRDRLAPIDVPSSLAERVRGTLEGRGLIRQPTARPNEWPMRIGLIAAGFIFGLVARDAAGRAGEPSAGASPGQYVLLLYGDPADDTGAVHVAREREYGRWASSLGDGARWVGGHELGDVVQDIRPTGAARTRSDRLAGYFVIAASTRERAADVARSAPHLKYGGRVVVMAVAP